MSHSSSHYLFPHFLSLSSLFLCLCRMNQRPGRRVNFPVISQVCLYVFLCLEGSQLSGKVTVVCFEFHAIGVVGLQFTLWANLIQRETRLLTGLMLMFHVFLWQCTQCCCFLKVCPYGKKELWDYLQTWVWDSDSIWTYVAKIKDFRLKFGLDLVWFNWSLSNSYSAHIVKSKRKSVLTDLWDVNGS